MTEPIDELRAAAAAPPAPPALAHYLEKVRSRAHAVTDADVAELAAAGISEDDIFRHTVAVAVAEGFRRLDAGLGALA